MSFFLKNKSPKAPSEANERIWTGTSNKPIKDPIATKIEAKEKNTKTKVPVEISAAKKKMETAIQIKKYLLIIRTANDRLTTIR